jgi:hypothetical protein
MTPVGAPETPRLSQRPACWRRVVGSLFAIAALLYLGQLVANNAGEFKATLLSLSAWQMAVALIASVAMLLLKALYHVLLCERLSGKSGLAAEVLPAYCTAQVVRYLPGKIWGVVYQANRLSQRLHVSEVVTANAIQTITTNILGAGIITTILAAVYLSEPWLLVGIFVAIAITETVHRTPLFERRLLLLSSRLSRRQIPSQTDIPPHRVSGTLILVLEWVAYFTIWFAVVGDQFKVVETVTLGTWYAAASLLAIAAIAVPGGLAVREAIFVALGSFTTVGAVALVGYAAALRVLLMLAEVACIPIAELLKRHLSGQRA